MGIHPSFYLIQIMERKCRSLYVLKASGIITFFDNSQFMLEGTRCCGTGQKSKSIFYPFKSGSRSPMYSSKNVFRKAFQYNPVSSQLYIFCSLKFSSLNNFSISAIKEATAAIFPGIFSPFTLSCLIYGEFRISPASHYWLDSHSNHRAQNLRIKLSLVSSAQIVVFLHTFLNKLFVQSRSKSV